MNDTAGAAGNTDAGAGAAGAAGGTPWFDGADQETVGYLQNRGWDKVDAKAAAFNAIKAHREAEKLIGAPSDQVLRLPKEGDTNAWKQVWQRLGAPADAKEYDFASIKYSDGSELDEPFVETARAIAAQLNLPKSAAPALVKGLVEFAEKAEASEAGEAAAKLAQEKDTLQKSWGSNFNRNLLVAQRTAQALGIEPEAVQTLEGKIGYAKVLEMFRNIGSRIGEDKFVTGTGAGAPQGPSTVEGAKATLEQRMNDTLWVDKLNKGDSEALREFHALTTMMSGA